MIRNFMTKTLFGFLLLALGIAANGKSGFCYTQPLEINSGISYPISLSTGTDAAGSKVFTDAAFLACIREQKFVSGEYIGYAFDLDEDGFLSREECETVRVLSLSGNTKLESVKGIEAFPKLRELYCNDTGLHSLNLSLNPRLQIVDCSDTPLVTLNIKNCTLLRELKISGCQLAALDLSAHNALTFLTCQNQTRAAGEYKENGRYLVRLTDLDANIDLDKISDVKIDGVAGDSVHSGYDRNTGMIYCTDEMKQISYVYTFDFGGVSGESVDTEMQVTLNLSCGIREAFDANGGSPVLPQFFAAGERDREPEKPIRDGYQFVGWYTDSSRTNQYHFGNTVSDNITLYAGWEKKSYQIFYKTESGIQERNDTVDWWTANLIPEKAPIRIGYTFMGWKTESGLVITDENASTITFGDVCGNSEAASTTLQAIWKVADGYKLNIELVLSDSQKAQLDEVPSFAGNTLFSWESDNLFSTLSTPMLPGHQFDGWYTGKTDGIAVTKDMTYQKLHELQFGQTSTLQIPTLYGRFTPTNYTIHYDTCGGSRVDSKHNIRWGSAGLLPAKNPTKKGYILAGWKLRDTNVTKSTKLNDEYYAYSDSLTLRAVWYKKYEPKGKIFKRYGVVYKVTKSDKKGNRVKLLRITKKKITIRNKVFLNGKYFKVTAIQKKALKKAKKIRLKVPKKYRKKYRRMVKRAGGKIS